MCIRSNIKKSKTITTHQFIALHNGPEAELHYRFAAIISQVYITFAYGLSMPILFPIMFLSMFNMYCSERLAFAFIYKKPPIFDNSLTEQAYSILEGAPIFMMGFTYWQLGNR